MLSEQRFQGLQGKPTTLLHSPNKHFPAWLIMLCTVFIIAGFAFTSFSPLKKATAASACTSGTTLNIVAHEDDDLLFLSPDLLHAIQSGRCVRTIFVTAGDNGESASYWQTRELGPQAAYAQMAGVANVWTQTDAGISGHPIAVFTLNGKPNISVAYMQLPDGNIDGSGFTSTGNASLQDLWTGTISTINTIDSSSSYTKATFTSTLTSLMTAYQPDQINTQDYVGSYGDGDHSDHHTVAYFTQAAQLQYTTPHTLTAYKDYATSSLSANVAGTDLVNKQAAFLTYALDDPNVCQNSVDCAAVNYGSWLQRQYTVTVPVNGVSQQPTANPGENQIVQTNTKVQLDGSGSSTPNGNALTYQWTQVSGASVTFSSSTAVQPTITTPASATTLILQLVVNNGQYSSNAALVTISVNSSPDLALSATATASSESSGQTANKAIDGVVDGYPGDATREWSTNGGGAGSWLKLTWSSPQTMNRIVLHDRPNLNDQVTGGNILFSDGSSVAVGTLTNDDTGVSITFPSKTITSLQFNITSVSPTTQNVGLAEIEAYQDTVASPAPTANAGVDQTVQVNTSALLNGSASSASNGKSLTYQWTQTAGPAVTLSSTTAQQPGFTTPSAATSLTFQLIVNDGQNSSSPDTINITVQNSTVVVTASSDYEASGWSLNAVNDGVLTSTPSSMGWTSSTNLTSNHTEWLQMNVGSQQTISEVDLYPRSDGINTGYGFPVNFTIQVSNDGSTWTTVVTKTGYGFSTGVQQFSFASQTARYVRVTGTSLRSNPNDGNSYRMQFAEMKVSPTNLAPVTTVTASSSYETSGWSLNNVNDGRLTSTPSSMGWTSNTNLTSNHTEWLQMNVGSQQTISEVDLYPRSDGINTGYGFPVNFTIQVSNDGSTWTTVVTKTSYALPTGVQQFSFASQNAQYVRVTGTSLRPNPNDSNDYRMQFAEMKVNPTDLARAATVTTSSDYKAYGWSLNAVNDGQLTSSTTSMGWTSSANLTSNHTEWLQMNVGSQQTISEVDLYPRSDGVNTGYGFPINFTIQVSNDGSTWTTVVTKTSYALPTGVQQFSFASQNAQYVRVTGTSLRPNPNDGNYYRMQFAEITTY